jgi:hypothetical protein
MQIVSATSWLLVGCCVAEFVVVYSPKEPGIFEAADVDGFGLAGVAPTLCWRHLRTSRGVEGMRLGPKPRRRWSMHGLVAVEPRLE